MADCSCNNFPASLGNVTFEANVGIGAGSPNGPLDIGGATSDASWRLGIKQDINGHSLLQLQRATDTSPAGSAISVVNAADSQQVFAVDVLGNITAVQQITTQGDLVLGGILRPTSGYYVLKTAASSGTAFQLQDASGTAVANFNTTGGLFLGGASTPTNRLDVSGAAAIGSGYAGVAAPANGLVVQGEVGIGTHSPTAPLHVAGNARVDGWLGIDTSSPNGPLDIGGVPSYDAWRAAIKQDANGHTMLQLQRATDSSPTGSAISLVNAAFASVFDVDVNGNMDLVQQITTRGDIVVGGVLRPTSGYYVLRTAQASGRAFVFQDASGNVIDSLTTTGGLFVGGSGIPVNALDISGGAVIGSAYAAVDAAPTNGLLVQGNVGIGTTAPGALLDVLQNSAPGVGPTVPIRAQGVATGDRVFLLVDNDNTSGGGFSAGIRLANNGTPKWQIANDSSVSKTNNLYFFDEDSGTYRLTIDTAGHVGIGTTSPAQALDVSGSVHVTGQLTVDGYQAPNSFSGPIFSGPAESHFWAPNTTFVDPAPNVSMGLKVGGGGMGVTGQSYFGSGGTWTDPNFGVTMGIKVGSGGIGVTGDSLFSHNVSIGNGLLLSGNMLLNGSIMNSPGTVKLMDDGGAYYAA